jgi:pimeloyl-ACP methyl ester carboxylesterase
MGARTARGNRNVDVFYVHPTTYRVRDQWNMDLGNADVNRWTDASVIARQAGLFSQCCRVFAPRYRQASLLAFSDRFMTGDGGKAYALAYIDVLRAFDQWQAKRNDGRPFVLVGHSQGGEMVMRLLEDRIDSKPLQNRMVAAYAIGIDFSVGYFGKRYQTLRPCERPRQVRCVLVWNAMTQEADVEKLSTMVGARFIRAYETEEGSQILCINPLTFDVRKPTAVATMSKGAVPGDPGEGPLRALAHGKVAARCVKGFLVVEADPALDLRPLPGGSMHYHEFGLFYADIQTNLKKRISAFR